MTAPVPATAGCQAKSARPSRRIPIRVNGTVIPHAEIARETQNHPAEKAVDAWLAAARALVVREVLIAEARRLALLPQPKSDADGRRETEDEALIRQLIEIEVATPVAREEDCRRYFDKNRRRFYTPALYEARHILLAAPPEDRDARRVARSHAERLIARLVEEPSAFAELATAHSACPSGKIGGHLGQIGPGQTVPEFEAALALLSPGAISREAVETRYGWHVVGVDRRIEGQALPFEAACGRIASWLNERTRRSAIRQYIGILVDRAEIEGLEMPKAPDNSM